MNFYHVVLVIRILQYHFASDNIVFVSFPSRISSKKIKQYYIPYIILVTKITNKFSRDQIIISYHKKVKLPVLLVWQILAVLARGAHSKRSSSSYWVTKKLSAYIVYFFEKLSNNFYGLLLNSERHCWGSNCMSKLVQKSE